MSTVAALGYGEQSYRVPLENPGLLHQHLSRPPGLAVSPIPLLEITEVVTSRSRLSVLQEAAGLGVVPAPSGPTVGYSHLSTAASYHGG